MWTCKRAGGLVLAIYSISKAVPAAACTIWIMSEFVIPITLGFAVLSVLTYLWGFHSVKQRKDS